MTIADLFEKAELKVIRIAELKPDDVVIVTTQEGVFLDDELKSLSRELKDAFAGMGIKNKILLTQGIADIQAIRPD